MRHVMFAALLGSVIAAPAFAAHKQPRPETADASASAGLSAASPKQRYCVVETSTGTFIPRKTCKTRAEWLDQGFDPLKR